MINEKLVIGNGLVQIVYTFMKSPIIILRGSFKLFYAYFEGELKLKITQLYIFYLLYKSMFVIIQKGEIIDILSIQSSFMF